MKPTPFGAGGYLLFCHEVLITDTSHFKTNDIFLTKTYCKPGSHPNAEYMGGIYNLVSMQRALDNSVNI